MEAITALLFVLLGFQLVTVGLTRQAKKSEDDREKALLLKIAAATRWGIYGPILGVAVALFLELLFLKEGA